MKKTKVQPFRGFLFGEASNTAYTSNTMSRTRTHVRHCLPLRTDRLDHAYTKDSINLTQLSNITSFHPRGRHHRHISLTHPYLSQFSPEKRWSRLSTSSTRQLRTSTCPASTYLWNFHLLLLNAHGIAGPYAQLINV